MSSPKATVDDRSTVMTDDQLASRDTNVWFYDPNLPTLSPPARELLEKYSHIPPADVEKHVYDIRESAWRIHPYPCIGGYRFLSLHLHTTPQYEQILSLLLSKETESESERTKFLDLGCCFGQELRSLAHAGVASDQLYGFDLRPEFFELGTRLFRDEGRFHAHFAAGDVFAHSPGGDGLPEGMEEWRGKMGVIYAGSFFHLFDRPLQIEVAKVVVRLLKPEAGAMVLGRQVGDRSPGRYGHRTNSGKVMFRHDPDSWRELWEEVGKEMGVQWEVQAELVETVRLEGRKIVQLYFCVTRK